MTAATAIREPHATAASLLDAIDRRIIVATQQGLPRVSRPYHAIAGQLGVSADDVMERLRRMLEAGVIRRIGAVPNHYILGYRANGMSVWDVPEERIRELLRDVHRVAVRIHRARFASRLVIFCRVFFRRL